MTELPIQADQTCQGILWDLDGVLVDTSEYHYRSWQEVLDDFEIPFDRKFFQRALGMNNAGMIELLLGYKPEASLIEEIAEWKEERFRQLMQGNITPLPGVLDWLQRWHSQKIPMAVASSASPENIDFIIDALEIRSYFEYLVSGANIPRKPDPAVFLTAAQNLGLAPARCLVIEDSVAGIEAARQAGMRCLAVATTYPAEMLGGANLVVSDLSQLNEPDFFKLFTLSIQ